MWIFTSLVIVAASGFIFKTYAEECGPERFSNCMTVIQNVSYGHPRGLFQNREDLFDTCPKLKEGIACVQNFAKECGTDMIAEDYSDQFEKPMKLIDEICNTGSSLRREYLQQSSCLHENAAEFSICGEKISEFLSAFVVNDTNKEMTMSCTYELMFRSCLMSTAMNSCGVEGGNVVRKGLQYAPISGLKTCFSDIPNALP